VLRRAPACETDTIAFRKDRENPRLQKNSEPAIHLAVTNRL